ncbi:MAG TPA: hypothetical protein VEG60_18255, partial [Candidatus Binatia bacterium]|nr:hypothetical protein [Candidatus Binatia bacterium]
PVASAAMLLGICLPSQTKFDRLFHWWLLAILLFMIAAGQGHRHPWYLLPVVPVAAAFAGRACDFALSRIPRPARWKTVVLGLIFFSSLSYFSFVFLKPFYQSVAIAAWHAANDLNRMAPPDALVAVADGGDPTCLYYSRRKGWHFLENFGAAPIDSQQAIAALERLRERGAAYLVLTRHQPWWWSERYTRFWSHLDSRYQRVRDTPAFVIFDLVKAESAKRQFASKPNLKLVHGLQPGVGEKELRVLVNPRL